MLWLTLRQLKSSDPDLRIKAAKELGAARQNKAVPLLIKTLQDENPQVRLASIRALGAIGHSDAVEPLTSALAHAPGSSKSRTAEEYQSLAEALTGLGPDAVKPLTRVLSSEDKEARRWSASALGMIKDARAIAPLVQTLEDSRSEVRKAAALALGEIGDLQALDGLIKALGSRDLETRRAAAEALGFIGSEAAVPALVKTAADPSEPVQLAAIRSLAKIGGLAAASCLRSAMSGGRRAVCEAAEAALKDMRFSPSSPEERAELAVLRGDFESALREGRPAFHALAEALTLRDPQMRLKAAEALAALRSPESVQPLLQALKDHHAAVQESAARSLAGMGEDARPGLEESLSFYDASVVRLSAGVLGEIGDPRSVPPLTGLIIANRTVPGEYPELFDAVGTAIQSLNRILSVSAARMPLQDLERIAGLAEEVRLQSPEPKVLDCRGIVRQAAEELSRR